YGNSGTGVGVWGDSGSSDGVFGRSTNGTGVHGMANGVGVFGEAGSYGVIARGSVGIYAAPTTGNTIAGLFGGNVQINGNLTKSSGSFKIDHPLNPANKYLYHSFVESPDMKNIYDGTVTLDEKGEAVEEDKGKERGLYLYPAGFNESKGKAVGPTGKLFADQSPNLENVASSQ